MTTLYSLHVKNMVCQRCILMVEHLLSSLQIAYAGVSMGRITLAREPGTEQQQKLKSSLQQVGLEIIENRMSQLIEGIKLAVSDYMTLGDDAQSYKLSDFIAARLNYDFGYLSDLFSRTEGITVERYFIQLRLNKVKELLAYDQLSLSEIAFETGFSSVHHLSAQFKKLTGITPSQFRQASKKIQVPAPTTVI
ncbi:MAG: helix-turn-helix transcriptional regulator [Chitinophagaceae bacterium]|nr:helix-turn-helix transcriptional regulator [Chitinophagaceae bacterium]